MNTVIRILVVDDHPVIRDAICGSVQCESDMTVIGVAEDGEVAISLTRELDPDIIISDLRMPVTDGLSMIKRLPRRYKRRVIVFTGNHHKQYRLDCFRNGVAGYLLKSTSKEELLSTIRRVYNLRLQVNSCDLPSRLPCNDAPGGQFPK